jgi:hypothetical protein
MLCAGLTLCACQPVPSVADQTLGVHNAQIRALLPGRDTTAAYFTLSNRTDHAVTLTGAHANQARAIEMHETVVRGDSVSMRRVEQHILTAGDSVRFEPGGKHLMIFGVAEINEPFEITFQFDNGEQLTASFSKLRN